MAKIEPSLIMHPKEIATHPLNSNDHPSGQIKELAAGLKKFTQYSNIAVWTCPEDVETETATGDAVKLKKGITYALKGNGLVMALWSLGWEDVEVKDLSYLSFDESVLLLEYDNASPLGSKINPAQMQANLKRARSLYVDNPRLAKMLDRAREQAGAVEGNGGGPGEMPEAETDRADELQEKWQVKPGDLFKIGKHRLLCGDCREPGDVARLLGNNKAALCHADPPYGMGKEKDGIANDNLYREKLDAFQMQWWTAARPYLDDNASAYIWGNAEDLWRLWYVGGLRDSERLTMRNEVVWDKESGQGMGADEFRSYAPASERALFFMLGEQGFNNNADNYWEGWEPIRKYLKGERDKMGWNNKMVADMFGFHPRMASHWFDESQWSFIREEQYQKLQQAAKNDAFKRDYDELKRDYDELKRDFYSTRAYFNNTHDLMTDVWQFPRVTGDDRHGHATPKPVAMMERIIKSSLPEVGICFVLFVGTGPEYLAAERYGRRVFGMELKESYCAVVLQRLHDAGLKAERIEAEE